jgi:hypothetical protein
LGLENEDQMIWSKGIEAYGYEENKVETVLIGGSKTYRGQHQNVY